jgi:hypothetical protein
VPEDFQARRWFCVLVIAPNAELVGDRFTLSFTCFCQGFVAQTRYSWKADQLNPWLSVA